MTFGATSLLSYIPGVESLPPTVEGNPHEQATARSDQRCWTRSRTHDMHGRPRSCGSDRCAGGHGDSGRDRESGSGGADGWHGARWSAGAGGADGWHGARWSAGAGGASRAGGTAGASGTNGATGARRHLGVGDRYGHPGVVDQRVRPRGCERPRGLPGGEAGARRRVRARDRLHEPGIRSGSDGDDAGLSIQRDQLDGDFHLRVRHRANGDRVRDMRLRDLRS